LGPEKFLVASGWGSKGKTLPAGCEQLGRHTKLKLCRKLHTDNIGLRNFIQLNWSSGLFPGKSLKFSIICDSSTNDIFSISRKQSSKMKYKN
jgi:hypothetical protein